MTEAEKYSRSRYDEIPIIVSLNEKQQRQNFISRLLGIACLIIGPLLAIVSLPLIMYNALLPALLETTAMVIFVIGLVKFRESGKKSPLEFSGYVEDMNPYQFELLVEDLYSKQDYKCIKLKRTGDSGADIIAIKNNIKSAIQVKHYDINNKIGSKTVRDLYGAIKMYDANEGVIVTTSYFTKPAIIASRKTGVILIDRDELKQKIYEIYYKNSGAS